ncbi:MAG: hypothetical protein AB7V77_01045 [Candidatus Woesearchaeota archaeon]
MPIHPFVLESLYSLFTIVLVPFRNPILLWQLAPVILMWIILEFYFGMHKHEELGWNTALGNGISLFWITISTMQYLFYNRTQVFSWDRFISITFLLLYAIFIMYISFSHRFSSKITYVLSAPTVVYFSSYLAFIYAYGMINATLPYLTAIIVLFLILLLFSYVFKRVLPNKEKDDEMSSSKMDDFKTNDFDSNLDSSFGEPSKSNTTKDPFDASFNSVKTPNDDFKF